MSGKSMSSAACPVAFLGREMDCILEAMGRLEAEGRDDEAAALGSLLDAQESLAAVTKAMSLSGAWVQVLLALGRLDAMARNGGDGDDLEQVVNHLYGALDAIEARISDEPGFETLRRHHAPDGYDPHAIRDHALKR